MTTHHQTPAHTVHSPNHPLSALAGDTDMPGFFVDQMGPYQADDFLDKRKVWNLSVDGVDVGGEELRSIVLASDDLGIVAIVHNGAYPALVRWERGGGGVISVPYAVIPEQDSYTGKELVVYGFVEERRPNICTDRQLVYAMGGFRDGDETTLETGAREAKEEGDISLNWTLVHGSNVVLDRATSIADATQGQGVEVVVAEVPHTELERNGNHWKFRTQPGTLPKPVRFYEKLRALDDTVDSLVLVGMTAVDVHRERQPNS